MSITALEDLITDKNNILVLTGAGISASSGIPTYRDHQGNWQRSAPIQHNEFIAQKEKRQRYWARSLIGWEHVVRAKPNAAHFELARWEKTSRINLLVTQNVDSLHQRAGSENVVDLHGRLSDVVCMHCGDRTSRADLQETLIEDNPELTSFAARALPDGDADIDDYDMSTVVLPDCQKCGGMLKPDVVFFGDNVPNERVDMIYSALDKADLLLVIGSSLRVYSGYRFCKKAVELKVPIACINQGETRADELFDIKVKMAAGEALSQIKFGDLVAGNYL